MNGRVTKARTRHSRATPSQAAQAKLLDAAADKGTGQPSTMFRGSGRLSTHQVQNLRGATESSL